MIELGSEDNISNLSFEYKVRGTFNMALMMPGWDSYYGYFAFNESGNVDPYEGVSVEQLGDGYIRVTFDVAALTKMVGTPNGGFNLIYIRGDWTDATGTIKNLVLNAEIGGDEPTEPSEPSEPTEPETPEYQVTPGTDVMIELETDEKIAALSFEYQLSSGTFNMALMMPGWDSYYGYFAFDEYGNVDPYAGVTLENLSDGYYRVTVDVAALNKMTGTPDGGFNLIYIRGAWTDGFGVIRNVTLEASSEETPEDVPNKVLEGVSLASGQDRTVEFGDKQPLTRVTFDYKVTSGTFNMALMPNWDAYYGYFAFDQNGNVDPYTGVTCEDLGNGYFRVTMDMTALNKVSGSPNTTIDFMYVRGNWTDAAGEITNICLYWD